MGKSLRQDNLKKLKRVLLLIAEGILVIPFSAWAQSTLSLPHDTLEIVRLIKEPVYLTVSNATSVYADRALIERLGDLAAGTRVQLLAYRPEIYYIQGSSTRKITVTGWVNPLQLSLVPTNLIALAQENQARREVIEEAIQNQEIALGMSPEDVVQSLGKPNRKSRSKSVETDSELWSYIRYERVPQTETYRGVDGFLYTRTIYIKMPVGELHVEFDDGTVIGFEETVEQRKP